MKNKRLEKLALLQRQYHRSHQWRLSAGGLFIPHSYADIKPGSLSYWDDVGFILNGRRIIVWWQHPRYVYLNKIDEIAWQEAGDSPRDNWLLEGSTKNYKRLGKSRKKIVSYTCRQPSPAKLEYYDLLRKTRAKLSSEGIDFEVSASWKRERLHWAMGVSLIAPIDVRSELEIASLADLARRLILGKTTLEAEFPGYQYGRADWLREQDLQNKE